MPRRQHAMQGPKAEHRPLRCWPALLLSLLALLSTGALAKPDVPPDLWQAFSEARHAFEVEDDGVVATNHGNGQRIRFTKTGIEVTSTQPGTDWRWGLTLTGYV